MKPTRLPMVHWRFSSKYPDRPVCKCGRGYGSKYDGLCILCRGCTAWEQKKKDGCKE